MTDPKEVAAVPNSAARPSQAVAAANNGSEPAPARIKIELISGGNNWKFNWLAFLTFRSHGLTTCPWMRTLWQSCPQFILDTANLRRTGNGLRPTQGRIAR
ncbi:hypothetical protein MPRG_07880 [Mycobacterium paragordonae]|uniref:Uncharacterized protein n=1 Tax=Mycobacterium paragordonae TaxID=1389713 RepID=A0ABQ1BZJ4_9MYCO|nr:hypothetical protein MPRG_07880 [Mycobacterium paragordonae]